MVSAHLRHADVDIMPRAMFAALTNALSLISRGLP
ncbi:MAG: hypothetical protein K0S65_3099 [Labilithrix sp.]|nr:hypothetical protein [Labilithrix sp.]